MMVQIGLGLASIAVSFGDGCGALPLMWWAQSIATLQPAAAAGYVADVSVVFKLHIVNGLAIFLVFPFTGLVNVWNVPVQFLSNRRTMRLAAGAAPQEPARELSFDTSR